MFLKSTFLALKKSGTSCPNWGQGGRGGGVQVIWTKSKRTATFLVKPSLNGSTFQWTTKFCTGGGGGEIEKEMIKGAYLIFVIFFTRAKFLENIIYTEKRQFFVLNL